MQNPDKENNENEATTDPYDQDMRRRDRIIEERKDMEGERKVPTIENPIFEQGELNSLLDDWRLLSAYDDIQDEKDAMLKIMTKHGRALVRASEANRKDRGIVLAAVTQYGLALKYASVKLKKDRGVVLAGSRTERSGTGVRFRRT